MSPLTMMTMGTQCPERPEGEPCSQVNISAYYKEPLLILTPSDFDYSMACTNSYSPPGPEPLGPSYSARTVVTYQVVKTYILWP